MPLLACSNYWCTSTFSFNRETDFLAGSTSAVVSPIHYVGSGASVFVDTPVNHAGIQNQGIPRVRGVIIQFRPVIFGFKIRFCTALDHISHFIYRIQWRHI